jgi:hypothetical protein
MQVAQLLEGQDFSPARITATLRTTKGEIAETLGLGQDAFSRASRISARKTQMRLREMVEILNRVEEQAGSPLAAPLRAAVGLWWPDAGPTGSGRQSGSRPCLSRPGDGRWLCLTWRCYLNCPT